MQTIKDFFDETNCEWSVGVVPSNEKSKKIDCLRNSCVFHPKYLNCCQISKILIQVSQVLKYESENRISYEPILI